VASATIYSGYGNFSCNFGDLSHFGTPISYAGFGGSGIL